MLLAAHHCIFVTRRDYDLASRTLGIRNRSGLVSIASNIPSIPLLESDRRVTRETIGIAETDRVILFFGDFHEKKGVLQLLLAASDARRRVPNLKLVLVGGLGEKHRTQSRQYAQRLDEAIERARSEGFLVTVHNPDAPRVARLIRAAELAVFPFLDGASENRGSMLAAIANETATLTTSGRSTPDGFANEFGVDVVTAGNVHDLAARIIDLLLDPDLLGDLRKRTALAARRILWDGVADRHIQIYQSLEC
jgi:glycosyltransferase involved in cell wall biosynthesis